MKIPVQRIDDLEADAYRSGRRLGKIEDRLTHLSGAVGDLSQGQRELRLDVRELRDHVTALDGKVTALDGKVTMLDGKVTMLDGKFDLMAEQLLAITRHLGLTDQAVASAG